MNRIVVIKEVYEKKKYMLQSSTIKYQMDLTFEYLDSSQNETGWSLLKNFCDKVQQ